MYSANADLTRDSATLAVVADFGFGASTTLCVCVVGEQRSVFVLWVHAHVCCACSLYSVCVRLATRMQGAQQGARGRRPFGARSRRPFGAPFAYPLSLTLCAL